MKVIIAGSRDITDYDLVSYAIFISYYAITEVVSGKEPNGVDALGERYAKDIGVDVKPFPADWNKHGKAAGPIRNGEMADYADAAVIVWDGKSPGSRNMIKQMASRNKPHFVFKTDGTHYHKP